jgi:UDPglucose 6-dehydrogenase
MKLTLMGSGYVGLVAGACFAESGHSVTCVDNDPSKLKDLKSGKIPFFEPGLSELVQRNQQAKRLEFSESLNKDSDIFFIAVGTPSQNGKCDLTYFWQALRQITSEVLSGFIVIKSTVPVGTALEVKNYLKENKKNFKVISNPEFLKQGSAIEDFIKPERVVLGTEEESSQVLMQRLYGPFLRNGKPLFFMDHNSAELSKYAANSFLAMKISFINEIANLSERLNGDIDSIRKVLTTDPRIGSQFLYPGVGFGGSCFPKDIEALLEMGIKTDLPLELFKAVRSVNDKQKGLLFHKMNRFYGDLSQKTLAIWGLSFKPQTDDMREAPSLKLIEELLAAQAKLVVFDPMAMPVAKKIFGNSLTYATSALEALKEADGLAILTEWNEFRTPDFTQLKSLLKTPAIFDGRNILNPKEMKSLGFQYFSIGRKDE